MNLTDEQKKDLKEYLDILKKDYRYNIEFFDKQSIYIASGALAISLTFVKDIVPLEITIYLWLYYISIIFFALSILIGFLSFLISSNIINHNKRILESSKLGKYKEDKITNILNYVNAGLISIGIILIVIFTITNLYNFKSKTMEKNEKQSIKIDNQDPIIKSLRAEDLPDSLRAYINTEPPTSTSETDNGETNSLSNQQNIADDKTKK